jgi:hypothetical protein
MAFDITDILGLNWRDVLHVMPLDRFISEGGGGN